MPILERLPDLSVTANSSLRLQADLGTLLTALNALDPRSGGSPLAGVAAVVGELNTRLDIDTQPLTGGWSARWQRSRTRCPPTRSPMWNRSRMRTRSVADFLGDSEIARQVGEGKTLNDVAQAVIAEALALFDTRWST